MFASVWSRYHVAVDEVYASLRQKSPEAKTEYAKLGTAIIVLATRNTFLLAKQLPSLDA